jgi:hypothetical protein
VEEPAPDMQQYSLENDHNVYVLGAGFSAGAGLPIMREFLSRMRDAADWCAEHGRDSEVEAIRSVLQFRLESSAAGYRVALDLENIEELFSLASAIDPNGLAGQMQRAIAATLHFCATTSPSLGLQHRLLVLGPGSTLSTRLDRDAWPVSAAQRAGYAGDYTPIGVPDFQTLLAALVGELSEPSPIRRNTFISFNYDLLVEDFLARSNIGISYGIPSEQLEAIAPWHRPDGVPLLKLHGSVNWGHRKDAEQKLVAYPSYSDCVEHDEVPLLVPPTWRKSFTSQLSAVWSSALDALRTATRLVVIGFSMPPADQHFRYLLAAGLRDNLSLRRIVFIDPAAADVKERAFQILRPELAERRVAKFVTCSALDLLDGKLLAILGRPLAQNTLLGPPGG